MIRESEQEKKRESASNEKKSIMTDSTQPTLLFIDDEPQLLEVFRKYYSQKNYRVLTARSGQEGLKVASREKPDLIVMDIRMPKMDGIQTLEKLRKKDKKTKVIMLTGYGTAGTVRTTADLGVSDFMSKPFDLEDLLGVIQQALGRNQS